MLDFGANNRDREADTMPKLGQRKNRKIKEYNFKNPDKFSKEHLRLFGSAHEYFCRQANMALNAALRMQAELTVEAVQQLTYGDYIASLPDSTITAVMNMYPFSTEFSVAIDREAIGLMVDRLLGGSGNAMSERDEMTDVEIGIAKDTLRKILFYIPEGWQMLIPTANDIEMNALELNPHTVQIIPATDIVALVTINLKMGEYEGKMRVCIPYSALEDLISSLSRQTAYKNDKTDDGHDARDLILNRLSTTDLEVKIVLARGQLFLSEIMNLQQGDVIKLDSCPEDQSEIWVADELKFIGKPGQLKRKYAVTIADSYSAD